MGHKSLIEEDYSPNSLASEKEFSLKSFFLQWEWLLIFILLLVFIVNSILSPYFLNTDSLLGATTTFLDKAYIVFPMAFIMIMRDIDISVGSTVALSSVVMATVYNSFGLPMEMAIIVCLLVGALCGLINGLLIVKFKELSAVIVTLGTMILFRGIAYIILEDQASGDFPEWFNYFGWGSIGNIPFILIAFIFVTILFAILLHKTTFGRNIYAIGSNPTASRFSGVSVDKIRVIVFVLAGLMAAVTAIFLASRMGSTRPNVATGYELEVITMAALGGISTVGGKGRIYGTFIAVFIIGFLQYGLGLINIPSQTLLIVIGALLILAVATPKIKLPKFLLRK
nr:ABC transporter permease [Lysinibacillus timonensis]